MRPNRLDVPLTPNASFDIRHEQLAHFTNPWHFHPELELNYIVAGTGTRFIGQSVERFGPGEILLLGSYLPHYWKSDPAYYEPHSELKAEAIVVRFKPDFVGTTFFSLPETKRIQAVIDRAAVGLKLDSPLAEQVASALTALTATAGFPQLMALLTLLYELSQSDAVTDISPRYVLSQQWQKQSERMSRVVAYLLDQFTQPVLLEKVADVANMNPASFCRYFRTQTGQTLTQFVTDLRIRYACELLIKSNVRVTEVGEQAGFDNVSHFVQLFRKHRQQTPAAFRRQMTLAPR